MSYSVFELLLSVLISINIFISVQSPLVAHAAGLDVNTFINALQFHYDFSVSSVELWTLGGRVQGLI